MIPEEWIAGLILVAVPFSMGLFCGQLLRHSDKKAAKAKADRDHHHATMMREWILRSAHPTLVAMVDVVETMERIAMDMSPQELRDAMLSDAPPPASLLEIN